MTEIAPRFVRRETPRLRSRLAERVVRGALLVAGSVAERVLVRLGHRCRHRMPGRQAIAAVLCERHRGAELVADLSFGARLSIPPIPDGIGYYLSGTLGEPETERLVANALTAGSCFLDLGANLGFYTMLAATRCGPKGRVFAFEAQRWLVDLLERSVELNAFGDRVVVVHGAVGAETAEHVDFFLSDRPEEMGIASVMPHPFLASTAVSVPGIAVEDVLARSGIARADVAKIDIEGAELAALRGMTSLLERGSPGLVVTEVLADRGRLHAGSTDPGELTRFLAGFDYAPHRITSAGRLRRSTSAGAAAEEAGHAAYANVGFAHASLRIRRPDLFVD